MSFSYLQRPQHLYRHLKHLYLGIKNQISGVISVELALIMFPFLFILFAILETGFIILGQMMVENATATASRSVRTGIVQESTDPLSQFTETLCDNVFNLVQCDELIIDVRSFTTFPDVGSLPPVPEDNTDINFDTGNPGQVVLVRVGYDWDYVTPFLQELTDPGTGTYVASAVFLVEPFQGAIE